MPGVLVDIPVVVVSLVGATSPQVVQIAVSGLTAGQTVTVTGSAAGATWEVRGGAIVAPSEQVILTDVLAPLNTPITYTANVDGVDLFSDPVTVAHEDRYVLQSLDGRTVIPFIGVGNGSSEAIQVRSVEYAVPGRPVPVVRWDVSGGTTGAFEAYMTRSASGVLRTHLREHGPVLTFRSDGTIYDFPPAFHLLIQSLASATPGWVSERVWSIGYLVVDDPEPSVVIATSTIADFNAVYAAATIADFNAEWTGSTIAEFNRVDWTTR